MSHDDNYRVGGTALVSTYARRAILQEGAAGKRADLVEIAYQHGVYVAERHWSKARLMRLRTVLSQDTHSGYHTQLSGLEGLLLGTGSDSIKTLARNHVNHGEIEAEIIVVDSIEQGEGDGRMVYDWPCWLLKGYWVEATASHDVTDSTLGASANLTQINVGGTHPTEPVFTVTCNSDGANPAIEDPATGDKIVLADSFVSTDVVEVDIPNRLAKKNGTRVKNLVTINRGHWMEFAANSTVDLDFTSDSGSWDVQTVVKDRFRG